MDAKKTGAFISQLRKEKQYTQKELAQRINVSDKAISRWETGRGFPDTSLLKPLSDALGISVSELLAGERIHEDHIKVQADNVIVASMEDSKRRIMTMSAVCISLAVLVVICCAAILLPMFIEPLAVKFVNDSQTHMLYDLATDSSTVYTDFEKKEFEGGYEYYLPNGTQRYVFADIPGYSDHPVMSYMHCSGEGMLFGFRIGDETVLKENAALGVESCSLVQYLEDNGFEWAHGHDAKDFGRPALVYIEGERCNWIPYTKDNVFINICLSAYEGRRLLAYDIGLIDSNLNAVFDEVLSGFSLTLEDPYGLVTSELKNTYHQWDVVTITAADTAAYPPLYLYINGQFVGKLLPPNPPFNTEYEITFQMWGAPITVLVTPENLEGNNS